jgi:hypothetical protein
LINVQHACCDPSLMAGRAFTGAAGEFNWATVSAEPIEGMPASGMPVISVTGPEPLASSATRRLQEAAPIGRPHSSAKEAVRLLSEMAAACSGAAWMTAGQAGDGVAAALLHGDGATVEECGICYARLAAASEAETSSTPALTKSASSSSSVSAGTGAVGASSVACARCSAVFHHWCIGDWLRALPTARRAFSAVIGPCPYCAAEITVDGESSAAAT